MYKTAAWLAHMVERQIAVDRGFEPSNTQGLKITEENVLSL